ncbi:YkvA family protein [Ornithinibacillus contaminans]|uniref:YkvA family protein n=1 Tax=Ornithinibacillus contaminans TaxID=694055 RepID=UPI00064DBD12|nr:YkvA family protein [Ornithinibacillus contaminans]
MAEKKKFSFRKFSKKEADYAEGSKLFEEKAQDYFENEEKTTELVEEAATKADANKHALGEAWDKIQLFFELVNAWRKKEYRDISKRSIIMVIATIIYFVSPIDLIPEFIVGLGLFDDAAVIAFTFKQLGDELEKFREWKVSEEE